MTHSVPPVKTIDWAGLTLPAPKFPLQFSKDQVDKMWDLAIRTDDVELLKSLIQNQVTPSNMGCGITTWIYQAMFAMSFNIFEFLVKSPIFEKELKKYGPELMEQFVFACQIDDQSKILSRLKLVGPYWLGENLIHSIESGNTLPMVMLSSNLSLLKGKDWLDWLMTETVFPSLEVPNHAGLTFLELGYQTYEDWFPIYNDADRKERASWLRSFKAIENALRQKRYGSLPFTSKNSKFKERL